MQLTLPSTIPQIMQTIYGKNYFHYVFSFVFIVQRNQDFSPAKRDRNDIG